MITDIIVDHMQWCSP